MSEPALRVSGEIENPLELGYAELAAITEAHQVRDVSRVDPKRKGDAVTLQGLLALVKPTQSARYLTLHASADDFHASIPLAAVTDRAIVIYSLDGRPLPVSAGGPVRFYIPDFAACHTHEIDECANVKFVDHIELTSQPGRDNRPHDAQEHAKLHEGQH